jgi:glutamate formiminotransferase/formiminotetrahydrofolate cyclodeaminase
MSASMPAILECIPNFSEGRDQAVLDAIATAIQSVAGVKLLHLDRGESAHRTVMTMAGEPEAVVEAAFRAMKVASERIDMRQHQGTHPRMGATDVCPLVPIRGITVAEAQALALSLAQRVGEELGIPVYLYEHSARDPLRRNLATIRAGEYEGFRDKIQQPEWKPDFGPQQFHPEAGQTVIGVRDLLVAYNLNLNTRSVARANAVAFDIRSRGRVKRLNGEVLRDAAGKPLREAGTCQSLKAIGWYIEEYGIAQVSTNVIDLAQTPVHAAFEAGRASARRRGMRVTGSELIGLIPLEALLVAGRYYLNQQGLPSDVPESELIHLAVRSLGLSELSPFNPKQRVIEYLLDE